MKKVLTNGCFDIIHVGHLKLLKEAKSLGDHLIVAIDSDKRVRELKGRCINKAKDRVAMLQAIRWVDEVVVFDDLLKVIKKIQPAVLVKGSDYHVWDIVGANLVKEVRTPRIKRGYSTTNLIKKIYESCNCGR